MDEEEKYKSSDRSTQDPNMRRSKNLRKMLEPTLKKKTKYKEVLGDDFLESIPVKDRNKYYSRISRRKHKEYVVELEKKVDELESKILELNKIIDSYKHRELLIASGLENDYLDFFQASKYSRDNFIDEMNKLDDETAKERFKELMRVHGAFGEYRILIIKKWFKTIIETLVPIPLFTQMQVARIEKSWSEEEYENLMKLQKKQALIELRKPHYSNWDRRMYDRGISPKSRHLFRRREVSLLKYREIFSEIITRLLNLRREIFQRQKEFTKYVAFDINSFKPKEFAKFIESERMVENDPEYSIHSTFEIPRKSKDDDILEYAALTDDEIIPRDNIDSVVNHDANSWKLEVQ